MSTLRGLISEKRKQYAIEAAAVEELLGLVTAELDWAEVRYCFGPNIIIAYNHKTGGTMHIGVKDGGFVCGLGRLPSKDSNTPLRKRNFSKMMEILADWLA